jgi:hypothetical protein
VERIADASGEATRSGGVLPDDLPRDVAFWPILLQNYFEHPDAKD